MRISSESKSPYFWMKEFPNGVEIFLDGEPVDHVLEADDEAGTVEVIQHNGAYPIFAGGVYLTETKTGKVEIKGIPT